MCNSPIDISQSFVLRITKPFLLFYNYCKLSLSEFWAQVLIIHTLHVKLSICVRNILLNTWKKSICNNFFPILKFSYKLNPKRCRLFGQLRRRGGDQSVPFSDNGLWWPQFSFKLHKQYLIWKLTFSAKFWNLSEVIEAYSLASGGYRIDRGQNEKKIGENCKITNFWLTEM